MNPRKKIPENRQIVGEDILSVGSHCFYELSKWVTNLQRRIIDLEKRVNELSRIKQEGE